MSAQVIPLRRMPTFRASPAFPTPAPSGAWSGYSILYRQGIVNHCPGCGKTHWLIGNRTAECAFCATALDLQRT